MPHYRRYLATGLDLVSEISYESRNAGLYIIRIQIIFAVHITDVHPVAETVLQRKTVLKSAFLGHDRHFSRRRSRRYSETPRIAPRHNPHQIAVVNKKAEDVGHRQSADVDLHEGPAFLIEIIYAVAVLQDIQVPVPVSGHEKEFLELIEMRDRAILQIQPVQTIVSLYPAGIPGADHIVDEISGKIVYGVTRPELADLSSVIYIKSVTGAYPYHAERVLTKRRDGTAGHVLLVGNLLQIIRKSRD